MSENVPPKKCKVESGIKAAKESASKNRKPLAPIRQPRNSSLNRKPSRTVVRLKPSNNKVSLAPGMASKQGNPLIEAQKEIRTAVELEAKLEADEAKLTELNGDEICSHLEAENTQLANEIDKLKQLIKSFAQIPSTSVKSVRIRRSQSKDKSPFRKSQSKHGLDFLKKQHAELTKRLEEVANPRYPEDLKERIANLDNKIKTAKQNVRRKEAEKFNENGKLQAELNKIRAEINQEEKKILEIEVSLAKNSENMCGSKLKNRRLVKHLKKESTPECDSNNKLTTLKQRKHALVEEINNIRNANSTLITDLINQKSVLHNQILVTVKEIQSMNK
eukprot:TRINITY_DN6156_c0_g4_i1.p1 TRINITY_DN6156_c0_g4~~TRINITY_DN6156_c0_g4_i1.p1  ORF type:complete len:333 (+),score=44.43 TRINITY_DN6156_c0_g4_i1:79-1077(+)